MPFDKILSISKKIGRYIGYKFPTNLQNFTQKYVIEVKIFQKVLGGLLFWKHPVYLYLIQHSMIFFIMSLVRLVVPMALLYQHRLVCRAGESITNMLPRRD